MQLYSNVFNAPIDRRYTLDTRCFSVEVSPINCSSYESQVEVAAFDTFTLARVDSRASVVMRKHDVSAQTGARRFSLLHVLDGSITVSHHQGVTSLSRGQFTLLDNSYPRSMLVHDKISMLLVCLQKDSLATHLSRPEDVAAQLLHAPLPSGNVFTPLLSMWEFMKEGSLEPFAASVLEQVLDEVNKAYARQHCAYPCSQYSLRRIAGIKQYIEANLGDPLLTVEMIAEHFNVSSRYLRSLFQGGEKLSQYILRRRLEACASRLINPGNSKQSITDIAFSCGFSSTAHFSRCFRQMYKETARAYRNRYLEIRAGSRS